jgi:hypothetical protein
MYGYQWVLSAVGGHVYQDVHCALGILTACRHGIPPWLPPVYSHFRQVKYTRSQRQTLDEPNDDQTASR